MEKSVDDVISGVAGDGNVFIASCIKTAILTAQESQWKRRQRELLDAPASWRRPGDHGAQAWPRRGREKFWASVRVRTRTGRLQWALQWAVLPSEGPQPR